MKISIITVNYNSVKYLENLLESIDRQTYKDFEFILVDNKSTDNSVSIIKNKYLDNHKFKWLKFIESDKNGGFAYGNNIGIKRASGERLLILNIDTILDDNFLEKILKYQDENKLEDNIIGFISGDLDSEKCPISTLDKFGYPTQSLSYSSTVYITGYCLFMYRDFYYKIGGLDNDFFLYFEETDMCLRSTLMGYSINVCKQDDIIIKHIGGGATTKTRKNRLPYNLALSYHYNHLQMLLKNYSSKNIFYIYLSLFFFYSIDFLRSLFLFRFQEVLAIFMSWFKFFVNFCKIYKKRKEIQKTFIISTDDLLGNKIINSSPLGRKIRYSFKKKNKQK